MDRSTIFIFIFGFILTMNLSWYAISDYWLRRDLTSFPQARKWTRLALALWMTLILLPVAGMVVPWLGNPLDYGPWLWLTIFYLWTGAIIFWMTGLTMLGLPLWGGRRLFQWHRARASDLKGRELESGERKTIAYQEEKGGDGAISRRQLLRLGLVATPPLLVTGAAGVSWYNQHRLLVYSVDLPVKNLPEDLEGFTITQLSDTHIGLVTGRDRIEAMVEAANSLKSDMTVVTGDILDQDIQFLPDLIDTMGQLKAPMGVYLCMGNHDKIYNANKFITTVRRAGLSLLVDEATVIDTGKTPIKLLGIDFNRNEAYDPVSIQRAEQTIATPKGATKILLAHHPHAFDAASQAGIDVTLAGHTHGGQLVLQVGDTWELFNPGNLLFRYVRGVYRSPEGASMFVHSGSGDWFPLRLGALCEVVQLRLVFDK